MISSGCWARWGMPFEGAEGLARPLLDVSALVVYGEPFNTQRRGGLEGVFVGLFTRLVCGGKLPSFVEFGVIQGCRFLKVRVDMLNGEVGASFLHSYPKECYGTAVRFTHQCSGCGEPVKAQVIVDGDSLRVIHVMEGVDVGGITSYAAIRPSSSIRREEASLAAIRRWPPKE